MSVLIVKPKPEHSAIEIIDQFKQVVMTLVFDHTTGTWQVAPPVLAIERRCMRNDPWRREKVDPCIHCGEPFQRHTLSDDGMYRCPPNKVILEDGAKTVVPISPRRYFRRGVIHYMHGSEG